MVGGSEAAPVISSQLVPDESVSPFRGELQTQRLNRSREMFLGLKKLKHLVHSAP